MGLLDDLFKLLPTPLIILIPISIFVVFGEAILGVISTASNIAIRGFNLVLGTSFPLMPSGTIVIFEVYLTYWVVMAFIFFVPLSLFALKYYSSTNVMG